jgi:hypothetical protein
MILGCSSDDQEWYQMSKQTNYFDFELEIGPGAGREYPVAVLRSPGGEARETMYFPFDELELQSRLKDLQIALLRSGGKRRRVLAPEEQTVQDFGRALFEALLSGEVRNRYDVSQREAFQRDKGLRLKLRIAPPELAALPWEFLYDPRAAEYLCLSRDTPLVRYLELPQPLRPLAVRPPLHILGVVINPQDQETLDVAHEKQRLAEAVEPLRTENLVTLTWLEEPTWRHLQRALRQGPWHVFHFVGHGGFDPHADEGFIALANESGNTQRLMATQLGRLLADHRTLRLVLLNSCKGAQGSKEDVFSSTAAILMQRGIPAVLAMQREITDQAAIEFARTFYETLADGLPVDAAVAEARKAISLALPHSVEWGTPVLHMRAPDGILFDVQEPKETGPSNVLFDQRGQTVEQQTNVAGDYVVQGPPVDPSSTAPASSGTEPASNWNSEAIRQLLNAAFSDGELTTLCFDHFHSVYDDFSSGMSKRDKTQRLLEHCLRHDQVELLLAQVRGRNPVQHARFAPQLKK